MKRTALLLSALLLAAPHAVAQTRVICDPASTACAVSNDSRENFTSNRRGTAGTLGNRNFEIDEQSYGQASGQIGGKPVSNQAARPSATQGNVGATQSRCHADGNGNTYCR